MATLQKRAAIYARIATIAQGSGESDFALENQIAEARLYCQKQGYSISEQHIYHEVFTGTQYANRPEFTRLRDAAKGGEFDVVVVVAYSRIARKVQLVSEFLTEMETYNVSVEAIREAFSGSAFEFFELYGRTQPGTEQEL